MVLEMKVPSPGESITEVEISQWLVKDGDIVKKDQTIAELDSDKATLDLPAEASGKITLKAEEGDSISVGDIVCLIDTSESQSDQLTQSVIKDIDTIKEEKSQTTQKKNVGVTPLARSIASEKGIDLNVIKTQGQKITKDDVLRAVPAMGSSIDDSRVESRENMISDL